jgi:hypothetical protein
MSRALCAVKNMSQKNNFTISDFKSWPVLIKGDNQKQVANYLWYHEGLYTDLPFGYLDSTLTDFFANPDHQNRSQHHTPSIIEMQFAPRKYYPRPNQTVSPVIDPIVGEAKVGVLRASHKIFNSEARIC